MNGYFKNVRSLFSAKTAPSIMTVFRSMKESCRQLRAEKKLGILFVLIMGTLYPFAVTSGVSAVYFIQPIGYQLRIAGALLFNIVFNLLLICCIYSLPFARLRSSLNMLLWTYLAIFTLFSVAHLNIYKQLFGFPSLMAVGDTNFQESYEFIISSNKATVILSTIATIPILCCLFISLKKRFSLSKTLRWRTVLCCWTFLFVVAWLGRGFNHQHNPFLFAGWMAREVVRTKAIQKAELQSSVAHQTNNPVFVSISRPFLKSVTHVLILGEATTSRRMSLYGYHRRTNPLLESIRANLLIDENACSSRGATPPSMKEIFTFADRDHENLIYEQPNLLQLMRAAGYRLYWLSNQQTEGPWDSQVSFLHRAADERVFINKRGYADGVSLDGDLLPRLKDVLSDGVEKRFIVVHLMGTHDAYDQRFPAEFGNFKTEAGLDDRILARRSLMDYLFRGSRIELSNAYDNAVLYNDKIVNAMLNMIHDSTKDYSVIYLSDHGEALEENGQFRGHIDGPAPKQVYEIPLFFVLSDNVIHSISEPSFEKFKENLHKKFEANGMIHTMLSLYGIGHNHWRSEKSLFSGDYKEWPRFCDGLE
ncbi:MAG: phosphoethanolamine transferase [Pseudomonadota bacterium]|nr:phosphoethanolamine transferase [Pseudomonadota bacterium]